MRIRKAKLTEMHLVKQLFLDYAAEHKVDLCFQNFNLELANLPGIYEEPLGCILVLEDGSQVLNGVVALKKIADGVCEMKRLYIVPKARKGGNGRRLSLALLAEAKDKGYKEMKLDTLEALKPAIALYRSLGFEETEAYYHNPKDTVIYFKKIL